MNDDTNKMPIRRSAYRFRASHMINCKITNTGHEGLGSVHDIVLASDNHRIAYVVVSFGGFFGLGGKLFALPWQLMDVTGDTVNPKPRIMIDVDPELLKSAPGFDKRKWPDLAEETWARQVNEFYRHHGLSPDHGSLEWKPGKALAGTTTTGRGSDTGRDPDSKTFHFRRVCQLIGMDIVGANQESLARIDDLIVDTARVRIVGAVLNFGDIARVGKESALVPIESVSLDRFHGNYTMACTAADLKAMTFKGGEWPDLDNDDWIHRGQASRDGMVDPTDDQRTAASPES